MPENKDMTLSFRVEFSIKCPRCDRPIPLDGPMETILCGSCKSEIPITRDYWVEIISDACKTLRKVELGQGSGSMMLGTFNADLSLGRLNPYCDQCKTDFEPSWEDSVCSAYKCASCGLEYPVSTPPGWLEKGVPGIKYLVNALLDAEKPLELASSSPVVLSCPSCSAALEADGTTRFVDCNYCNSQVYLPDDVWMKFHKAKRKRRWFVVCK